MNAALLTRLTQFAAQLATLGIVPKGYLTAISSGLSILAGVGLLAGSLANVISSGELPETVTLQEAFGLILLTQGAQANGVGRKIEKLSEEIKKTE